MLVNYNHGPPMVVSNRSRHLQNIIIRTTMKTKSTGSVFPIDVTKHINGEKLLTKKKKKTKKVERKMIISQELRNLVCSKNCLPRKSSRTIYPALKIVPSLTNDQHFRFGSDRCVEWSTDPARSINT